MFTVFRNAWKIQDLRKKILYTIFIIVIFRIGCAIPVPFIDADAFRQAMSSGSTGSFTDILNVMSGGSFKDATLFALSITPYINASIIINLLTVAIPALERLSKEGEAGRQKLNKITKVASLVLSIVLGIGYYLTLKANGGIVYTTGAGGWFTAITIVAVFAAGASLIMWLGDCINEKGIGNGISMILFASIVSRGLDAIKALIGAMQTGANIILIPVVIIIFVVLIGFVVFVTEAERRIPIQYAKMVKGRKMYGGQNTHIPIKVAMNGVMPIIFAMSLMSIPSTIVQFTGQPAVGTFWYYVYSLFAYTGPFYAILYFLLIIGFSYFYSAIQYNPIEISNNLRKNNGGIPGIRPGKPTTDYITKVISKITIIGAIFLGIIAILPIVFSAVTNVSGLALGGTTILILVGVALETSRSLESQMMMRHHKGFLE